MELLNRGIKVSMDGKGRYIDNIFVERLWRPLKYEEVYLHAYDSVAEAREGIHRYFRSLGSLSTAGGLLRPWPTSTIALTDQTIRTPAGSTLATPSRGPRDGVHLSTPVPGSATRSPSRGRDKSSSSLL